MKSLMKTSLLTIAMSTLVACGGGGSDTKTETPVAVTPTTPTPKVATISGNVIDGYIVGATIFMDLNFNGQFDEGEPNTVTVEPTEDADGNLSGWTMELEGVNEDCGQYVPLVTHVPVGAIDLDDPDNPITEEYSMTVPPSFAITTDDDMRNVTPLTSVIWKHIEREFRKEGVELSCESIIEEQATRKNVIKRLEAQEKRVAKRYNRKVKDLYSDYVKNGDAALHGLAKSLVPGLTKGYADTVALEKSNAAARVAFVEYYFKDNNSVKGQNWSRREYVQTSKGNWDEKGNNMERGLNKIGAEKYRYQQRTTNSSGLEAEVAISLVDGQCTVTEYFTEKNGTIGYGLANVAGASNVDWSMCRTLDRVALNTSQLFITKTYYSDGDTVKTESAHQYEGDNEYKFEEMIGATAQDLSGGWLSSAMSFISLSFEDDYGYDADSWYRIDNRYSSEEFWNATQEVHMHNHADVYEVSTYNPDGTYSKQCGTWSGGTGSLTGC